ncbi:MAG: alpha/beta hydrolase fold domain-containing protein [Chitinivibrionales bacterium]|nr:alpha/beta hydrolase fold domain-containing protein [Chitinivibrionales bacterium]
MDPYLLETDSALGAVVICPGGAYVGRAPSEGANVARRFNKEGFHAFVVYYRTAPHRHPAPFMDATRAVRLVRDRADEWKIRPDKIALCGFSAGGHLAASVGVHFDKWRPKPAAPIDTVDARPDALILCYPVISSGELGHEGSFRNLLGDKPPTDLLNQLSLELQVSKHTPPAFLWHTADDAVRVDNSLLFAQALKANEVPFEVHVYHQGGHGLNLAKDYPHVASWMRLCCEWLHDMGW